VTVSAGHHHTVSQQRRHDSLPAGARGRAGPGELVPRHRLMEADNRRMAIDGATQTELNQCAELVITMKLGLTRGDTETDLAAKAAARAWSEYGDPDLTRAVQVIITEAVAGGYAQALGDVRDGRLDGEIAAWRPGLARG